MDPGAEADEWQPSAKRRKGKAAKRPPPEPLPFEEPAPAPAPRQSAAFRRSVGCGTCRCCRLSGEPCCRPAVQALAAQGHLGAQLTQAGAASLGQAVSVFWLSEGQWFSGRLVAFNPLEPAFLVLYGDGDWVWESLALLDAAHLRPAPAARLPQPPPLARATAARLEAAAEAGHLGAHLSLLGQVALGYMIEVPAGRGYNTAQIVSYEPRTHLHLLYYVIDSGEEWVPLHTLAVRRALLSEDEEAAEAEAELFGADGGLSGEGGAALGPEEPEEDKALPSLEALMMSSDLMHGFQ